MKTMRRTILAGLAGLGMAARGGAQAAAAAKAVEPQEESVLLEGAPPHAGPAPDSLLLAARCNQEDSLLGLLDAGAAVDATDALGLTALHLAALHGHVVAARMLLAHGADVNARDSYGLTPLHLASQYGHTELVRLLLLHGADVSAKTYSQGLTPLHWAAFWGHVEAVDALLRGGARINVGDRAGNTPLTWAVAYGHHDMARLLARKGGLRHDHEKVSGLDGSFHVN